MILFHSISNEMFKYEIKGAKLSPSRGKLVVYNEERHLLVVNIEESVPNEYKSDGSLFLIRQEAKHIETKILGVYWLSDSHVLIVLTTSIQLISLRMVQNVNGNHFQSKLIKQFPIFVRFHVYSPENGVLIVAAHGKGHVLYPFKIFEPSPNNHSIVKLNRFDLGIHRDEPEVNENEIYVARLYEACFCLYVSNSRQEMVCFEMTPENIFVRSRTFNLFSQGVLNVSFIDSLIILHNSDDKLSMAYDLGAKQDTPVSPPMPMIAGSKNQSIQLYSPKWMMATPNFIIDTANGLAFELCISIERMPISIRSKIDLVKFLFRRKNSKAVLLQKIKSLIVERKESLRVISSIFFLVNKNYSMHMAKIEAEKQKLLQPKNENQQRNIFSSMLAPLTADTSSHTSPIHNKNAGSIFSESGISSPREENLSSNCMGYSIIDQGDMYSHVLNALDEDSSVVSNEESGPSGITTTELIVLLVEYIRSLKYFKIPVQHLLQKFLIELLVKSKDYPLLHQYVQYKVIEDSIPTAWQILHMSSEYEPAYQIALDMMDRLEAYENMCEILISRKEISQALQIMYRHRISNIPYKVIFEHVVALNDKTLFYNTMEILIKCNIRNRGTSSFTKEDKVEQFLELYNRMFGKSVE
jgi:hypothetical protein